MRKYLTRWWAWFQPFLRFYKGLDRVVVAVCKREMFQPFLRFYHDVAEWVKPTLKMLFQPFLRFYTGG